MPAIFSARSIRFGVSLDTRDYEPDPNRGVFVDAALDIGSRALGSRFTSTSITFSETPRDRAVAELCQAVPTRTDPSAHNQEYLRVFVNLSDGTMLAEFPAPTGRLKDHHVQN